LGTEVKPDYRYTSFTWLDTSGKSHHVTVDQIHLAVILLANWVDHAHSCATQVHVGFSNQWPSKDSYSWKKDRWLLAAKVVDEALTILVHRMEAFGEQLAQQRADDGTIYGCPM
jgi:hypothetical protein